MSGRSALQEPDSPKPLIAVQNVPALSQKIKSWWTTLSRLLTQEKAGKAGKFTTKGCSAGTKGSKPSVKPVTTPKQKRKIKNGKLLGNPTTHSKQSCRGRFCCIHNPSNHKMVGWNMIVRFDRGCLIERLCPKHAVGHPDPDSLAWINRNGIVDSGVHACCSCHCKEEVCR